METCRIVGISGCSGDHHANVDSAIRKTAPVTPRHEWPTKPKAARLHQALRAHFRLVWRTLRGLGVHTGRVDDAAQQVFLTFAARLDEVEAGRERGFLVRTAVGIAANHRRSQQRQREIGSECLEEYQAADLDPETLLLAKQRHVLLDQILDRLENDLRLVFVLFELERLTGVEIAQLLQVPAGTVASRLRRARRLVQEEVARFRQQLAREDGS